MTTTEQSRYELADIFRVYQGSDGDATRALYAHLETLGPIGHIAVNLFRACKTSERAKKYRRGPGHITESYSRKDWSVDNAAKLLSDWPQSPPFEWGWAIDEEMWRRGDPHYHVVYFELPSGQISFHVGARGPGPDYSKPWDGIKEQSAARICSWIAHHVL